MNSLRFYDTTARTTGAQLDRISVKRLTAYLRDNLILDFQGDLGKEFWWSFPYLSVGSYKAVLEEDGLIRESCLFRVSD